ncbi:MAG: hypothetical protein OEU46_07460 [Alphaproteobacteria bacterium]|nr:hypothetical protein [Alphaproteobacteria bacterium]
MPDSLVMVLEHYAVCPSCRGRSALAIRPGVIAVMARGAGCG